MERLAELGVNLFRLNLSHTKVKDAARIIRFIQKTTDVPLCLDTEGAQVRTGDLVDGEVHVRENRIVEFHRERIPGDPHAFNLYPNYIVGEFVVGDFVHIDADVLVRIVEVHEDRAVARVLSGGRISQNKAVTVERDIRMPPLTDTDVKILAIGRELGIRHVALSFAHRASDLDVIREAAGNDAFVISKIECREALRNLDEITTASDAILIDRGDLSREVPIERIPATQKHIIRRGRALDRKVYVATNLMESMTTAPAPTRAEVNDVYNTLMDGASGLVLAGETAVGKYPIGCAGMILKIIPEFEKGFKDFDINTSTAPMSLLVEPHGGTLVQREDPGSVRESDLSTILTVDDCALVACEQIATGVVSPVTGFMDRSTVEGVLYDYRLPSGVSWTVPFLLPVSSEVAASIDPGSQVGLRSRGGELVAAVAAEGTFSLDLEELANSLFRTTNTDHPGVARLYAGGDTFLAGEVTLCGRFSDSVRHNVVSPVQARSVFAKRGWNRVVGFLTRNAPHRIHEHIQLAALEESHGDGLFIVPEVGPDVPGAFSPRAVFKSYQSMIDFGRFPREKVLLGGTPIYRHFAGPREAVFRALCLKNLGCSHVVIGPEGPDLREFYAAQATRDLFERLGDLGVTPVFFDELGYDEDQESYGPAGARGVQSVSSAAVREAFRGSGELPTWHMRDLVQGILRGEMKSDGVLINEALATPREA